MKIKGLLVLFALLITSCSQQATTSQTVIKLESGEYWWGGAVNEGHKMPLGPKPYSLDLYANNVGNQCAPLLVSTKGRYIWSEKPFYFEFKDGNLVIIHQYGPIVQEKAGNTLAEACRAAASRHFPASGKMPDPILFSRPQFNTWIELVYNQNQEDILKYARAVVDHGFPPGALMIDDNWQRYYGNFEFKAERFPDPKGMVDELHRLGFKVMLWVCPFVSPDSAEFRELRDKRLLLLQKNEGVTQWKDASTPIIVPWWNGFSAVLDFSNPAAERWFKEKLQGLQETYGIDGFKFDAGDTKYYPNSSISYREILPNDHTELFGRIGLDFPLNEFRAMWKMGGQPLVQRLRDKNHDWVDLQKLIPHTFVQALLGYTFSCPDLIGGGEYESFQDLATYDQDLVVRSTQCQALMPMMQFSVAPWRVLDKPRLEAVKQAVQTRQKFVPYILELAEKSARTGEPIVTPLEYHFPDRGYAEVLDQFMLGDRVLVAPVVEKGRTSRTVVLPPGKWKCDQGKTYEGGTQVTIEAPINRLPYFERVES
ncbi:MAG TPA: glycoside hydrolase family 31 protein [Acidobacteriota bacterium]|nr:glycoside hydrolase family 31 protein [Acidobacteriota bacterium]